MRLKVRGLLASTLFALTLLWPATVRSQDEEYVPPEQESGSEETDLNTIDDLLAQDEGLTEPDTYAYDPGARRDPFRSLIQRRQQQAQQAERPKGPAGLLIDEIEVQGVFLLGDGPVVQVQSASQETSYLLRPGDQLWDGDVVSISIDEVVFKQSVNDPTALKPFREVVKKLKP